MKTTPKTTPKTLTTDPLWSWAIFAGVRPIENRAGPSDHVGPILVHASQSMRHTPFVRQWILRNTLYLPPDDAVLAIDFRGRVIGEVDMIGCVRPDDLPEAEREFAVGPWCWRLRNPRPFVYPFPRGDCPGLSEVPEIQSHDRS